MLERYAPLMTLELSSFFRKIHNAAFLQLVAALLHFNATLMQHLISTLLHECSIKSAYWYINAVLKQHNATLSQHKFRYFREILQKFGNFCDKL